MKNTLVPKNETQEILVKLGEEYHPLSSLADPSTQTKDTYKTAIRQFVEHLADFQDCEPENVDITLATEQEILLFFVGCVQRGLSRNTLKLWYAAVQYLFVQQKLLSPLKEELFKKQFDGLIKKFTSNRVSKAATLTSKEIIKLSETYLSENNLIEERDRTLIIVGFTGGFRIDELVATRYRLGIDCQTIHETDDGFIIEIMASKTGYRKVLIPFLPKARICPATVLKRWLDIVKTGQLFQRISKNGRMHGSLSAAAVRVMLKERSRLAGVKNWHRVSGHTLRRSFVTEVYKHGASLSNIGIQTGQSKRTVLGYIDEADFIRDNPARKLF